MYTCILKGWAFKLDFLFSPACMYRIKIKTVSIFGNLDRTYMYTYILLDDFETLDIFRRVPMTKS